MFRSLRLLALLRRVAIALERQNYLYEQRLALEYPHWARDKKVVPLARRAKSVKITHASPQAFNEKWRERFPIQEEE